MGKFTVQTNVIGMVGTNCYLVYDADKSGAVLIDPAENAALLLNQCRELGLTPEAILLTHGHFDHIGAVSELLRAFPVPVYAGRQEQPLLSDPQLNLSAAYGRPMTVKEPRLLEDGQEITLLGRQWKVIATPGHTAGSVCYYVEQERTLFSGDTLFCESYGRTDFPTGSGKLLTASVTGRLFALPEGTVVYPGHEAATTIGHEKRYNPLAPRRPAGF